MPKRDDRLRNLLYKFGVLYAILSMNTIIMRKQPYELTILHSKEGKKLYEISTLYTKGGKKLYETSVL